MVLVFKIRRQAIDNRPQSEKLEHAPPIAQDNVLICHAGDQPDSAEYT